MRVNDLARLLNDLPEDAEIRIAFADDPLAGVGSRDLPIQGISDCFGPPNAPELTVPDGAGVYWIVTSHLIEVNAPTRTRRKKA